MTLKAMRLDDIASLIRSGQQANDQRFQELRVDFEDKHKENREHREKIETDVEALESRVNGLENRVSTVERDVRAVVGDNTGDSGLLHEIKDTVDTLKTDMAVVKEKIQDAPAIRKWVYGAMAIVGAAAILLPTLVLGIFELMRFLLSH